MGWRKLLLPLSGLYWIVTTIRNLLYDFGLLSSKKFKIPVICIGNLSVGGTGKSPHVIMVAEILKDYFDVAMLSRGYGRKTSGLKIANYNSKVYDIGDEPLQFFNRFKNKIVVAVGENRVNAIEYLINSFKTNAVIMDDGFQHRQLKPGFSILLTTFKDPYPDDYLLPAGNLREPRHGAKRANIIIVTKCPEHFTVKQKNEIAAKIKPRAGQKLYFSKIVYSQKILGFRFSVDEYEWGEYDALVITGIARSGLFVDYVKQKFRSVQHMKFSDHHNFSIADIRSIEEHYDKMKNLNKIILTTEKDYMRLKDESALIENLFYLPIEIELDDYDDFKKNLLNYAGKN
ncbi:MAG: tetraacyldisaccharide 4'-kinase [Weeksellaceae bacterium]